MNEESPIWKGLEGREFENLEIKKGIPIPSQIMFGKRSPLTTTLGKLEVGDCIDLPNKGQKFKSDLYIRAKTVKIKITLRTIIENEHTIVRLWRVS